MTRKINLFIFFLSVGSLVSSQLLDAAPQFGRGGPPGGGDRGGFDRGRGGDRGSDRGSFGRGSDRGGDRGGFGRGGFDPTEMLKRFDRNNDGKIDPNELDERTRGFATGMLARMDIKFDKAVSIKDISAKIEERRKEREGGTENKSEEEISKTFGIPTFEEFADEMPPIPPDFFLEAGSPLLMTGPLEARYTADIISQVDRTLRSYDRNRDSQLDQDELRRGRFTSPPVEQSDLNKDGKLSRIELAERYVVRNGNKGRIETDKKKKSSSTSASSSREDWRSRFAARGTKPDEKKSSKTSSSKSSSSSRKNSSSRGNSSDKITAYAKSVFEKYDANKDGVLDKTEAKSIRSLPSTADSNKDGNISLNEVVLAFGGKGGSSSSGGSSRKRDGANNAYLVKTGAERSGEAGSEFQKLDSNVDGLIQMSEYTKSWSAESASAFTKLDTNNDGTITVKEWEKGGGARSSRSSSRSSSRDSSSKSSPRSSSRSR